MLNRTFFYGRKLRLLAMPIFVGSVFLLTSVFVSPTLSCPGPPPQPLRQLYVNSESVVIARVGKSEVKKVEETTTELKTALLVSSTLKGESKPVVYVDHYIYGDYKDELSSATSEDVLLVFLNKVEDQENYSVDMTYGLKKLSEADLAVYLSRIDELASLMKSGTPSDTEIVEWLVRCAEEPATRWEGSFELAMSTYMIEQENVESTNAEPVEVSEERTEETPGEGENGGESEAGLEEYGYVGFIKSSFARLLTVEQKNRLTNALLHTEKLTDKDSFLLDLVNKWDDPRLVPFLLAQLDLSTKPDKNFHLASYHIENLMTIVANKLNDEALKAITANFNENVYLQEGEYVGQDESEIIEGKPEDTTEEEAAAETALVQRRNAQLQHFVTLALSTVPKSPAAERPNPVESVKP